MRVESTLGLIFFCLTGGAVSLARPVYALNHPATRDVELKVKLESGAPDLEHGMILNDSVQACLRREIGGTEPTFLVRLAGRVGEGGEISAPTASGPNARLNVCLVGALKHVAILHPAAGPFRLRIWRGEGASDAKAFRLKLGVGPTKYE